MAAIVRALVFLIIGQSYGRAGFQASPAYWAFCTAIANAIADDYATINSNTGLSLTASSRLQCRNRAVDGSAILERNDGGAGYWVDDDLETAGPLLTAVISAIGGYSPKPLPTIWSHGEQDAGSMSGEAEADDFLVAAQFMLDEIREAISSGNPNNQPVWVDMLGPRFPQHEFGEYLVRDRLIDLVENNTRVFRGAEKYAVQLDGTTHPTAAGYRQLGAHDGRKVASWLVNTTQSPAGPSIDKDNITRLGDVISVPIIVPGGQTLIKPSNPDFFGLFDANENRLQPSNMAWEDNTLMITEPSASAKMRYPAPTGKRFVDITKIIRLSDPVDPIYPGEPGFVLESMKTHTF